MYTTLGAKTMISYNIFLGGLLSLICLMPLPSEAADAALPEAMQKIMQQEKYKHAHWGVLARDVKTKEILFELNSNQLFLPASTTKLFSVAALLQAYGDTYRFKTPLFAIGKIHEGRLDGDLILVGQGDLTMGGRQGTSDSIAYTKLDHIIANNVPGAILTPEDPLRGLNELAKQLSATGLKEISGHVLIDDRLFVATEKRGSILSPTIVNENLLDIIINPSEVGQAAAITWRPKVEGYSVENKVKTVEKGGTVDLRITSDELGKVITVEGAVPTGQGELVRTFSLKNPNAFARAALIQALRAQGIAINPPKGNNATLPAQSELAKLKPLAFWLSPPLSEYAKLILKVSHNLGADLVPLLLAVKNGEKTFEAGMIILGKFVTERVKISPDSFVFTDAAGGDENRLTPKAEVLLLEYLRKLPAEQFKKFYSALPILGVDGSLEDFGKNSSAAGKVRAKTGTGVTFNAATNEFFLTTQTLAGYIEGKNGHLIEFMICVNNGKMPLITDIFPIFEDLSQMTGIIYDQSPQ